MKPIRTPDANVVLTLPGGTQDNDLPAQRALLMDTTRGDTREDAKRGWITIWQPDDAEARQLEAGACVQLTVWGEGHPPVAVGVTDALVPERELIDRGHVDRALGHLYAALRERILAAGQQFVIEALPDDAPRTPESEGPRCVTAIEALDVGLDQVGADALGLPTPETFADLWTQAVDATRPPHAGGPTRRNGDEADHA